MTAQSTPVNVTGSGGAAVAIPCTYRGLSISSTAGADVVVYDNASTGAGLILAQFTLAAKGDKHIDIADGTRCLNGIYITASAAIQGHVRIG